MVASQRGESFSRGSFLVVSKAAALDTTRKEPLEKDSPLWEATNCYITPHDSAHSLMSLPRSFNLFLENVANLKDGKPIKNLFEL